jgi:hypothetical protein
MLSRKCLYTALALIFVTVPQLGAQQITGRVLDQSTGQPLAAVQVFIAGSGLGALSQQNGRYLLLNVPAGTHTINAQRIGYGGQTAEITVAAGETAVRDFRLAEQALGLDEIIVTGTPGGTQRRAIGNTVTSVSAAELTRDVSFGNVQQVLQGRTPGVRLAAINGTVGSGSNVEVRGIGTFNLGATHSSTWTASGSTTTERLGREREENGSSTSSTTSTQLTSRALRSSRARRQRRCTGPRPRPG